MWIEFEDTVTSPKLVNTNYVQVIRYDDEYLTFELPHAGFRVTINENRQEEVYESIARALRSGDSYLKIR